MIGFDVVVQSIVGGLLIGCVYALIAIGFTILLGVVRYTNIAAITSCPCAKFV